MDTTLKYMQVHGNIVTKLSVCLSFPLLWVPAPLFPEKKKALIIVTKNMTLRKSEHY
jgi:hypothetical protein